MGVVSSFCFDWPNNSDPQSAIAHLMHVTKYASQFKCYVIGYKECGPAGGNPLVTFAGEGENLMALITSFGMYPADVSLMYINEVLFNAKTGSVDLESYDDIDIDLSPCPVSENVEE